MDEPANRRGTPRAPIELKVEYKKLNTFFADYTKNISKGGTFIRTDRPLPVGTEFVFKLHLPRRREPFVLRGMVVWVNQADDMQKSDVSELGMGIRFVFGDDAARTAFEADVEQMMVASLGAEIYQQLIKR